MRIAHDRLKQLVTSIFRSAGCEEREAERVAHYLVEANLAGHDSHGVIRIPSYVTWLKEGRVRPGQHLRVIFENEVLAVVDGQGGFGQVIGEETMRLGIAKAQKHGVGVVALRNSGHLGQIGAWALMAARANLLSLHFVNTTGAGILVAPHGGINRRLSANPIAAGVPVAGREPIVLDMSCCTIAEGKIKVALNKGVPVPDGCLIDPAGKPTSDPKVFYGPPPGAILSIAGHKGYGLGILTEVLAGALSGGACSDPKNKDVINNMLTILLAPTFFQTEEYFSQEIQRFIDYVKSSERVDPAVPISVPGEPEAMTRARRSKDGIDLDDTTWNQIMETCRRLQMTVPDVAALQK